MSGFFPILVACLCAGLVFSYIGLLIIRSAPKLPDAKGDPTKIQLGPVKVSTGNAIVAIFIVAAICMGAVPSYWLHLSNTRDDAPVTFETRLDPIPPKVEIVSRDFGPSQFPQFRIYRSSSPQHFSISSQNYDPIDVEAYYDWSNKRLEVIVQNRTYEVPVNGVRAALTETIPLHRAKIAAESFSHNVPLAQPKGVTPKERTDPDPAAQVAP